MIAFLADEDFDNDIVRGVLLRLSDLDMVCVQDVSLLGESDPVVLEWAAREKRVLLTHDIRTMRRYAYLRLEAGLPMPGVFVVPQSLPVGQAINEVLLLAECSLQPPGVAATILASGQWRPDFYRRNQRNWGAPVECREEKHMPRAILNLQDPADLRAAKGQWRFAPGLVPGEPNEGFVSQLAGSPARLVDYDDSAWEARNDLTLWHSRGFTFAWYRAKVTLPETVDGRDIRGARCLFETCIDDYGEIWINGECDRERGAIQGFNVPQRVLITTDPQPGQVYTIALLAANGPLAAPGGAVFVRYAFLAFEWRTPGY